MKTPHRRTFPSTLTMSAALAGVLACTAPGPKAEAPKTTIGSPEVSTPALSTPALSTPALSTPEVSTPEVSTPALATPALATEADSSAAPFSLAGWTDERIALPPGFAPELPEGQELLLFAPGMFVEGADDYWSYVFLMQIAEPASSEARVAEILELYYDGLIRSVGSGKPGGVPEDPAQVQVSTIDEGLYHAEMHLIDAFVTMQPIDLHVEVRTEGAEGGSYLSVLVSPQPRGSAIWTAMEAALTTLEL